MGWCGRATHYSPDGRPVCGESCGHHESAAIEQVNCIRCAKTKRFKADRVKFEVCPDGAKCHGRCADACWRVSACAPLSDVFPDDEWPRRVKERHLWTRKPLTGPDE